VRALPRPRALAVAAAAGDAASAAAALAAAALAAAALANPAIPTATPALDAGDAERSMGAADPPVEPLPDRALLALVFGGAAVLTAGAQLCRTTPLLGCFMAGVRRRAPFFRVI
jgi:hypothetical protein